MQHAYLFEVRGIQRFLFASGKLRDMLAASELLDHVCAQDGLLDETLAALKLTPKAPRRAGGTFYLVFTELADAERFRATWRLAFSRWVPGVEAVDTLSSAATIQEAIRQGIQQLSQQRNKMAPDLPRPGPLVERSPRTGLAAVCRKDGESLDLSTARLRDFERPSSTLTLEKRFLGREGFHWPRNFENTGPREQRFPMGENRLVGLIHADGNGIGQVLRVLNQATRQASDEVYVAAYAQFSAGLSRITQQAAQAASEQVLVPQANEGVLPARPLILGGDDLTILVRSDLAEAYARVFLDAFQQHSHTEMQALAALLEQAGLEDGARAIPHRLTASAGICHAKTSFPFQTTHALAESLCRRAKDQARDLADADGIPPATLAFHKMEGAVAEDAATLFRQFHLVQRAQETFHLALPAYSLFPVGKLPCLDDLGELAACFSSAGGQLNDRPLRELATLWRQDAGLARQAYQRWRQLSAREHPRSLQQFDTALERLLRTPASDLPCSQEHPARSPLSDLLVRLGLHTPVALAMEAQA